MQSSSISDKEKKEEPILAMESSSISDKEKKEEPVFAMESSSVSDKTKEEEPVFAMESSSDKGKGEEPVLPKGFPDHCPYLLIGAGLASLNAFKAIKTHDPKAKVNMILSLALVAQLDAHLTGIRKLRIRPLQQL